MLVMSGRESGDPRCLRLKELGVNHVVFQIHRTNTGSVSSDFLQIPTKWELLDDVTVDGDLHFCGSLWGHIVSRSLRNPD